LEIRVEISHVSTFKVAFFDVDSMEVMWHGNYVTFLKFHYLIENEKGEKLSEANTAQAVIEMKSLQTCFEMPEALKKALKAYNEKEKR